MQIVIMFCSINQWAWPITSLLYSTYMFSYHAALSISYPGFNTPQRTALHQCLICIHTMIILDYSGADTKASDNCDMNPFMLAVVKCRLEVVKAMMKKDSNFMSLPMGSGKTVIHWALEEGHHCCSAFFKVCFFILIISYTALLIISPFF